MVTFLWPEQVAEHGKANLVQKQLHTTGLKVNLWSIGQARPQG